MYRFHALNVVKEEDRASSILALSLSLSLGSSIASLGVSQYSGKTRLILFDRRVLFLAGRGGASMHHWTLRKMASLNSPARNMVEKV